MIMSQFGFTNCKINAWLKNNAQLAGERIRSQFGASQTAGHALIEREILLANTVIRRVAGGCYRSFGDFTFLYFTLGYVTLLPRLRPPGAAFLGFRGVFAAWRAGHVRCALL